MKPKPPPKRQIPEISDTPMPSESEKDEEISAEIPKLTKRKPAKGKSSQKNKKARKLNQPAGEEEEEEVEALEEKQAADEEEALEELGEEAFLEQDNDSKAIPDVTNRRKPTKAAKSKAIQKHKDNTGASSSSSAAAAVEEDPKFVGDPIQPEEARRRWPNRYPTPAVKAERKKQIGGRNISNDEDEDEFKEANAHFTKALVDGILYDLYDEAYVSAGEGEQNYICKIVEMFEATDGELYFNAQWYYRATDTVILHCFDIDSKRVFYSDVLNINPLDCLVKKLNIARFSLNIDPDLKGKLIEGCDYYCDMKYLLPYSTFQNFPESAQTASDSSSTISSEVDGASEANMEAQSSQTGQQKKPEKRLLDLYSGCGGMSTGLCLGSSLSNLNLVTSWAVDLNKHALDSLKLNHPDTEVREETAEDFLQLLKEWKRLCVHFKLVEPDGSEEPFNFFVDNAKEEVEDDEGEDEGEDEDDVYEVEKIVGIRCGQLSEKSKKEEKVKSVLLFKVHWKGYNNPGDDTWEPLTVLSKCEKALQEFVFEGFTAKLLPLPGDVHVVCGGPPCQGISGFNRFRNAEKPLEDEKNVQLTVFMDIVQYLKPNFVLMENVVDILKFSEGFLGRYALGRLVGMDYQTRMGLMCAGAYGLPQFRMRVFYWGALPTERLPQFPLPTHDVVFRGQIPTKWQDNHVAYNIGHTVKLARKLLLKDALSDLPAVTNHEVRDSMFYGNDPQTDFQKFIRQRKEDLLSSSKSNLQLNKMLFDHFPLMLNDDDYQRVCRIPKRKGANFRDLPGVAVDTKTNVVYFDPEVKRKYLDSGKPLVPDYAMTFVRGTSTKPFGRLWWDEIVTTVVTRAEPHNHVTLHPVQDRVLTVRENARLQGFPDYYQLVGPVKQRYTQIGNAVAVPVARALGYALGLASTGCANDDALLTLPKHIQLPDGCPQEGCAEGFAEVVV